MNTNRLSRWAGWVYLGVVLTGLFSLMYVPSKLLDYNDSAGTFQRVTASESLFRSGIAAGLFCYGFFLFLPLVLYKLFKPVNENMAALMVLLAIISVPMYFINVQHQFTALSLIHQPYPLKELATASLPDQFLAAIRRYDDGMRLIHIFSGLWLFPFGYLVFTSNFLPKALGLLLMLGCFGYLFNFFGRLLVPEYAALGIASYISLPASMGEIGTCLWLILVGAKEKSIIK